MWLIYFLSPVLAIGGLVLAIAPAEEDVFMLTINPTDGSETAIVTPVEDHAIELAIAPAADCGEAATVLYVLSCALPKDAAVLSRVEEDWSAFRLAARF